MGFTYGTDQNSSLGVGVSASGAYGSWSEQGTWSVDGGASQTWPMRNKAHGYARISHFEYKEYLNLCSGDSTKAVKWQGADITVPVKILKATNCQPEYAPTTVTLNKAKAWTYSQGVSVSKIIGINLSAQTGYTQSLAESYEFTDVKNSPRWLCGRNDDPNSTSPGPGYVVAGKSRHGGS